MGEGNDYAWQIGRDESGAFKKKKELSVVGCEEAANVLRSQATMCKREKKIP
jgi:hypothetical protein